MMSTQDAAAAFRNAEAAATYDTRIPRRVPGYHLASDLAVSAIRARHGSVASVAVVGSGTGAEIIALARNAPVLGRDHACDDRIIVEIERGGMQLHPHFSGAGLARIVDLDDFQTIETGGVANLCGFHGRAPWS